MYEFSMNFTVHFSDINQNKELSNHGFLRLMQETASIHSDNAGFSIRTAEQTGLSWVLLSWNLKVISRPKWNEKITVTTWVREFNKYFCNRDFDVIDERNNVIAIASSKWVMVDTYTHTLTTLSPEISTKYPISTKNSAFSNTNFVKLHEPETFDKSITYSIQKRDLDANHHVNNLSYLDFAYEIIPIEFNINNLDIVYKKESKYGDKLVVSYSQVAENNYIIVIKEQETNKTNVIIQLY